MKSILLVLLLLGTSISFGAQGLVVHTAEFGVGKFHRADNKAHTYSVKNVWSPFILPDSAPTDQPFVQKNTDGSFTVFFSTLDELMSSVVKISRDQGQKVSVLNVHGHGLPGAMWFPKDQATMNGWSCADWKSAANGSDDANYDQYYSPVSVDEINQIRDMSNNPNVQMGCTVGLKEWQKAVAKMPEFKSSFATDAQLHFLSCVVGLGSLGDAFTKGIAELLLPSGTGRVETSMNFGLGDWSMLNGMGFWDYVTDSQVSHDNSVYSTHRNDSEIAQKGTIRIASMKGAQWNTALLGNRDFLSLQFEAAVSGIPVNEPLFTRSMGPLPSRIRVPGTTSFVNVELGGSEMGGN